MGLKGPLQNGQEIQDVKQRVSLMEENLSSDPEFALQGVNFASLINLTGNFKTRPTRTRIKNGTWNRAWNFKRRICI